MTDSCRFQSPKIYSELSTSLAIFLSCCLALPPNNMMEAERRNWRTEYGNKIAPNVRPHPTKSCLLWRGGKTIKSPTRRVRYGFIFVSWLPGIQLQKRKKWPVHRVKYIVETGRFDIQGLHVSHLCHSSTCVNIDHLSLEPAHVNNNRKGCLSRGHCHGEHGEYPPCIFEEQVSYVIQYSFNSSIQFGTEFKLQDSVQSVFV